VIGFSKCTLDLTADIPVGPREILLVFPEPAVLSLSTLRRDDYAVEGGVSGEMDIEFHYYMTHLIALRAGFGPDDALAIAYSSQYTDDNAILYRIGGGETAYESIISQTVYILKPQEERQSVYPIFHFCPGTRAEILKSSPSRKDGRCQILNTVADNRNARMLFADAMKSGNFYRIGIGTHMYADTFCHRDFAGWKDGFNEIGHYPEICAIGHAHAGHQPDIPNRIWEDTRLISRYREKKNKGQILAAAGNIFDFYCRNTKPAHAAPLRKKLLGDLGAAVGEETEKDTENLKKKRMSYYKDLLGRNHKEYDEKEWFNAAAGWKVDGQDAGTTGAAGGFFWKGDCRKSDWFNFQEAAKAHRAVALKVLGKTFEEMRVDIAKGNWQ
jgi:hypothetical protein